MMRNDDSGRKVTDMSLTIEYQHEVRKVMATREFHADCLNDKPISVFKIIVRNTA